MTDCYYFSVNLYRNYDKDILALKECDVVFSSLVKLALYYFVRGKKLNIFVSGSFKYDFNSGSGKAYIQNAVKLTDPLSIRFLRSQINYRERLAFVRCALRAAMIRPLYGAYFNDDRMIEAENKLLKTIDLSTYNDLIVCHPRTNGKIRNPSIIRQTAFGPDWLSDDLFSSEEPVGHHVHNSFAASAGERFKMDSPDSPPSSNGGLLSEPASRTSFEKSDNAFDDNGHTDKFDSLLYEVEDPYTF